jgi:uncharacterized phage protein (TIGR01671 family)
MREILFRGKAIHRDEGCHRTEYQNGEWVYGLVTKLYDEQFKNLPAEMTNTNGISGIEIDYKTIGQYTNMLDKNGKKIFEGDIVDFSKRPDNGDYGAVIYDADETEFGIEYYNIYRSLGKNYYPENIEVIGNIYDNPKLVGR